MEKEVKKYIRENANRIWKDNEDKTFHYPKVKEEYLAITKKELQRFAEIIVEDVEKLFSQELDRAREEVLKELIEWTLEPKEGEWLRVPEENNGKLLLKLNSMLSKLNNK